MIMHTRFLPVDQEGNIMAPGHNMRVQAGDPMHRPQGNGRQWVEGWRLSILCRHCVVAEKFAFCVVLYVLTPLLFLEEGQVS